MKLLGYKWNSELDILYPGFKQKGSRSKEVQYSTCDNARRCRMADEQCNSHLANGSFNPS